jgi:endoplasmic reticulum chaperone BiP
VEEAEKYAEEDRLLKERIDSRNGLESYLYTLKNSLEDDNISQNVSPEDAKEIMDLINETLDWLEENPEASKKECDDHKKEVEQVANPVMRQFYGGGGGGAAGDGEDFYDADL